MLRSLASCSDHQAAVTVTGGARLAVAAMRDYPDTEEVIERSIGLLDMLLTGDDTADAAFDDMQAVNGLLQVGPALLKYRSHAGIQVSTTAVWCTWRGQLASGRVQPFVVWRLIRTRMAVWLCSAPGWGS